MVMIPTRLWLVGLALSLCSLSIAQNNSWFLPGATNLFYADNSSESFAFNPAAISDRSGPGGLAKSCNPYFIENLFASQLAFRYTLSADNQIHFSTVVLTNEVYTNQVINLGTAIRLFEKCTLGAEIGAYRLNIENYGQNWGLTSKLGLRAGLSEEITCGLVINNPLGKTHKDAVREPFSFQISMLWGLSPHLKAIIGLERDLEHEIRFNAGLLLQMDKFEIRTAAIVQPAILAFEIRWMAIRKLSLGTEFSYHFSLGFTPGLVIIYSS
jgi:hypothetical protein